MFNLLNHLSNDNQYSFNNFQKYSSLTQFIPEYIIKLYKKSYRVFLGRYTYAYRRMPFGLSNAPTTFQHCMLSIFSDMVERIMEVYMDDIIVYGKSFDECLIHLEIVLHRCIEKNLVLN